MSSDRIKTESVFTLDFRSSDDPAFPVRVPEVRNIRVTRKRPKGGGKDKGIVTDVWGSRGDDPTKPIRTGRPRATKVEVQTFATRRGIERKAMNAYLLTKYGVGKPRRMKRCRQSASVMGAVVRANRKDAQLFAQKGRLA